MCFVHFQADYVLSSRCQLHQELAAVRWTRGPGAEQRWYLSHSVSVCTGTLSKKHSNMCMNMCTLLITLPHVCMWVYSVHRSIFDGHCPCYQGTYGCTLLMINYRMKLGDCQLYLICQWRGIVLCPPDNIHPSQHSDYTVNWIHLMRSTYLESLP